MPWCAMVCHGVPWCALVCHGVPWYSCTAVTVARQRCQAGPGTMVPPLLSPNLSSLAVLHPRTTVHLQGRTAQWWCSAQCRVHGAPALQGTGHCSSRCQPPPGTGWHRRAGQSRSGDPRTTGHHRAPRRFEGRHRVCGAHSYFWAPLGHCTGRAACWGDLNWQSSSALYDTSNY